MAATKNGGGRDLLARRMLNLERAQGATNAHLDVTNERLGGIEHLLQELLGEFRAVRQELGTIRVQTAAPSAAAFEDLRHRVIALEERRG